MHQVSRRPLRVALALALVAQLQFTTATAMPLPIGLPMPQPVGPAATSSVVLVYGGTPSGVLAAIAARRNGTSSVVLLEPTSHVGGMLSSGLNVTDVGDKTTIGGITKEFFSRMAAIEGSEVGRYRFESGNAERVFRAMLSEAGVTVLYGRQLLEAPAAVTRDGTRISTIRTTSGETFTAKVFIDASYEGDLMARAGVSYTVGREGVDRYGEEMAGVQQGRSVLSHVDGLPLGFPVSAPGPIGSADDRIQESNFRLCFTTTPANQVPFPEPAGYDAATYALFTRYMEALTPLLGPPDLSWLLSIAPTIHGKYDVNDIGVLSMAVPGANYAYPDGSAAMRAEILAWYRAYAEGLLYFLANDPSVPATVRDEMAAYGLCRDEFTDNGNWPYQLYLREGRRMIGSSVLTSHDIDAIRSKPDIIAIGSFEVDLHVVSRWVDAHGNLRAEGQYWAPDRTSYAIPYSIMTPRRAEVTNLLVPVTSSVSHVAQASVRVEPQYMMMGEAAGVAAALAAASGTAVQDVDVATVQTRLRAAGADLTDPGDIGTSPFYRDIVWAYYAGVTSGCGAGRFCPMATVTREQMAAFLARALRLPKATRDYFVDDAASPFQEAINRVADAGITMGCGPNTYCPLEPVTREQMASFLARAYALPTASIDYFSDDAASPHQADINRLAASGITSGCGPSTFCPTRDVTRGEMLAFLHRAASR